jgi:thiamine phosphate synthase YjbQ (UPF0047 family)
MNLEEEVKLLRYQVDQLNYKMMNYESNGRGYVEVQNYRHIGQHLYNKYVYSEIGVMNVVDMIFKAKKQGFEETNDSGIFAAFIDSIVSALICSAADNKVTDSLKEFFPKLLPEEFIARYLSQENMSKVFDHIDILIKGQLDQINGVLRDTLKLHGAIALVSEDPAVREQTMRLLKENGINFQEIVDRYNKKD